MWIYRANSAGYPESGGFSACTTNCIKYNWLPGTQDLRHCESDRRWLGLHHAERLQLEQLGLRRVCTSS